MYYETLKVSVGKLLDSYEFFVSKKYTAKSGECVHLGCVQKLYLFAGDGKLFSCFYLVCSLSSSAKHTSAMFCLGKKGQGSFLCKQTDLCSFLLCRMKNNYLV